MSDSPMKKTLLPESAEEVLALAKTEGVELNDQQLEAISGGEWDVKCFITCEKCGAKVPCEMGTEFVTCPECGHRNGPLIIM